MIDLGSARRAAESARSRCADGLTPSDHIERIEEQAIEFIAHVETLYPIVIAMADELAGLRQELSQSILRAQSAEATARSYGASI